jgi:hypothetical protein
MIKSYFLALSLTLTAFVAAGQCTIDYNNSKIGVTPNDLGTICVNKPIRQTLQLVLPNDTTIAGFTFNFDSVLVTIDKTTLPTGTDYKCANGCKFYRTGNAKDLSRGCIEVFGTPTVSTNGSLKKVKVHAKIWVTGPILSFYEVDYFVDYEVLDANNPLCTPNGLNNFKIQSALSIYPNPSKGNAILNLDLPSATNVSIQLYDVLGNNLGTIYKGKMNQGLNSVSTESQSLLDQGMYMIKVDIDTDKGVRTYTERMIVK